MVIKEEKIEDIEIKEENKLDGEIGDIIEKDGELLEIEEAPIEGADDIVEPKPGDDDYVEKPLDENGEPIEKPKPTEGKNIVDDKPIDENATQIKILEFKIKKQGEMLRKANLTPKEVLDLTPIGDLEKDLPVQEALLDGIDEELNPEEYAKQKGIIKQLKDDIGYKENQNRIDERYNSADNKEFLKTERTDLESNGYKFSDVQWDAIAESAEPYLDGGKYTKESVRKGLIDIMGAEATDKMYQIGSEAKVRKDIKSAVTKVTKSVQVTKTGIAANTSSFTKKLLAIKDQDELDRQLDRLNESQLALYEKAVEKNTNL